MNYHSYSFQKFYPHMISKLNLKEIEEESCRLFSVFESPKGYHLTFYPFGLYEGKRSAYIIDILEKKPKEFCESYPFFFEEIRKIILGEFVEIVHENENSEFLPGKV